MAIDITYCSSPFQQFPSRSEKPSNFQSSQQMVIQGEQAGISWPWGSRVTGMGKLQTVLETKSLPNAAPGLRFLFICLSPWEPLQLPTHLSALQARKNILAWHYNHDNHQFFLPCLLQSLPAHSPILGLIQTKEASKTKAISQSLFFF